MLKKNLIEERRRQQEEAAKAKKQASSAEKRSIYLENPFDLVIAGVDHGDETHPLFDKRSLVPVNDAQVQEVREDGIIEPISAAKRQKSKHGDFYPEIAGKFVAWGQTRVRWARAASLLNGADGSDPNHDGLIYVPTLYVDLTDSEIVERRLPENSVRNDLSVLDKAELAHLFINKRQRSKKWFARRMGVTLPTVDEWLKVHGLADDVKHEVAIKALPASSAAELSKLPVAEQKKKIEAMVAMGAKPTVRNTRKAVREDKIEVRRPAAKVLDLVIEAGEKKRVDIPDESQNILRWARGTLNTEEAVECIPWLAEALRDDVDDMPAEGGLFVEDRA